MGRDRSEHNIDDFFEDISPDIKDVLCRVSMYVTVNGEKKQLSTSDFISSLVIDYDQIEKELETLPSLYSFFTMLLAEAEAQLLMSKKKAEYKRSMLHSTIIGKYDEETNKITADTGSSTDKLPQWQAKMLVESDEDLNRLDIDYILKKKNYSKLKGIVDSIRMKSEHIRSLSGFKKQEIREHK